jgi:hypothetical protein
VVILAGLKDYLKPCILKCLEELGGEATMAQLQYCLMRHSIETYIGAGVMAISRVLGGLSRWGKVEKVKRFRYRLKK